MIDLVEATLPDQEKVVIVSVITSHLKVIQNKLRSISIMRVNKVTESAAFY